MYANRAAILSRGLTRYAPGVSIPAPSPIQQMKRGWFGQLPAEVVTETPYPVAGAIRYAGGGRVLGLSHREVMSSLDRGANTGLGDWTDLLEGTSEGGEDLGPSNTGPMPPATTPGGGGILESLWSGFGQVLGKTATDYATLKSREVIAGQTVKTANAQYQARLAMPGTFAGMSTGTLLTLGAVGLGLFLILRKK